MSRLHRLRSTRDFQRLRAEGRSGRSDGIVAQVGPHDGPTRLGVTVGRRTGSAVVRNRLRRRLRAAYLARGPREGFDVVLVGRAPVATAPFTRVEEYVRTCLAEAGAPRSTS